MHLYTVVANVVILLMLIDSGLYMTPLQHFCFVIQGGGAGGAVR